MFDLLPFGGVYPTDTYFTSSKHRYSLAATGIKFKDCEFNSRQVATKYMYNFIDKKGLHVSAIYDDKHFKTYVCDGGIKFYINRI